MIRLRPPIRLACGEGPAGPEQMFRNLSPPRSGHRQRMAEKEDEYENGEWLPEGGKGSVLREQQSNSLTEQLAGMTKVEAHCSGGQTSLGR